MIDEIFKNQQNVLSGTTKIVDDNFLYLLLRDKENNTCHGCSNNKPGQINFCHCTLGAPKIT